MFSRKLFPYALTLCCAVCISTSAFAQTGEGRARLVLQNAEVNEPSCSPDDPIIISTASAEDIRPTKTNDLVIATKAKVLTSAAKVLTSTTNSTSLGFVRYQPLILAAIDKRLGARYVWGATGPSTFDCSGFVWSIFQSAGINFERGSARSLWARFPAPAQDEKYKFGTLVFFGGLAHVGVVADEKGFYHASRHHGVIYSPFNDYWVSRIDGFRRVPVPAAEIAASRVSN